MHLLRPDGCSFFALQGAIDVDVQPLPEPGAAMMLAFGSLGGLARLALRRKRAA